MGLMGVENSIIGSWKPYSWNKFELPMSLCERDLCHGIQDFTLEVDDALEGDFRLEIMEENEYYIYTFPLTAQLSNPMSKMICGPCASTTLRMRPTLKSGSAGCVVESPIVRLVRIHTKSREGKS